MDKMESEKSKRHENGIDYKIRPIRVEDLPKVYTLLAENDWDFEMDYLMDLMSTDPRGLMVMTDANEEIIGNIGVLPYNEQLGTCGMVTLKGSLRGQGLGKEMFRECMKMFREYNIGLNSLNTRVTFYQQFGWTHTSFSIQNTQGPVNADFIASPAAGDFKVVTLKEVNFKDFVHYDAAINTAPRERFLYMYTHRNTTNCFVATRNGNIVGYCVLRPADVLWKIQPLYADSKDIAHALFCKAASLIPKGENVVFSYPTTNVHAVEIAKANGLKNDWLAVRVYNKWIVNVDVSRVYSISSAAYGLA